jgi:LuxR family transcriptional activator of bioluminescence operon
MDILKFHASLQNFADANSIEELTELCRKHAHNLGFDHFVYALRIPTYFSDSKLLILNGYPDSWVDHYFVNRFYSCDPVLTYCIHHLIPIEWHNLVVPITSPGARFMNEASEFGLKSGVSMPVHSPQGDLGILSFSANRHSKSAKEITGHSLPYLHLLAGHMHEALRRLSDIANDEKKVALTFREQECLRWVADGKTSWEISRLLGMSERTVNFHLNNAMLKLNVSNRQHAVAKAALQRLIHPCPF